MNHRNVREAEELRTLIQRMRESVNHESNDPFPPAWSKRNPLGPSRFANRVGIDQGNGEIVHPGFAQPGERNGRGQLAVLGDGTIEGELPPALRKLDPLEILFDL